MKALFGPLPGEGWLSFKDTLNAILEEAKKAVDSLGASVWVHTYNGMRGLTHRELSMVGAMWYPHTTAELISVMAITFDPPSVWYPDETKKGKKIFAWLRTYDREARRWGLYA